MKKINLNKALLNTVCLQLVLAPISSAYAQSTNDIIQGVSGAIQQFTGGAGPMGGGNSYQNMANEELMKLGTESIGTKSDLYFDYNVLKTMPGFEAYIAKKNKDAAMGNGTPIDASLFSCAALNSLPSEMNRDVCSKGKISNFSGIQQDMQAKEAYAYYEKYDAMRFAYEGYSISDHKKGQAFGKGCQEKALEKIEEFFADRLNEINTASDELDKLMNGPNGFNTGSLTDLNAVKESTALLNGSGSPFYDDFKDSNLFDFASRFQSDACKSIHGGDTFNEKGIGMGLNGLSQELTQTYTGKGNNAYSPEQYLQNADRVEKDIKSMAQKVSKQVSLNFSSISANDQAYAGFIGGLRNNIGTETGVNALLTPSALADVQATFQEDRQRLNDKKSDLAGAGVSANLLNRLHNVDTDKEFNNLVNQYTNSTITSCINNSSRFKDNLSPSRIYVEGLSSHASEVQVAKLLKEIERIMADDKTSEADKRQKIQAETSRFSVRLPSDYTYSSNRSGVIKDITRRASERNSAATIFSDFVDECKTQFDTRTVNGSSMSGKQVVENLKSLKTQYRKLAEKHSSDMEKSISNRFVECNGDNKKQNSSAVGSCSVENFNMKSDSFCTKAANSCATNLRTCSTAAKTVVKEIKDDRKMRVNNFNNQVKKTAVGLHSVLDKFKNLLVGDVNSKITLLGVTAEVPKFERVVSPQKKHLKEFQGGDDSLNLLDINSELELATANLKLLKTSIEKQQTAVVAKLKIHIDDTKRNYDNAKKSVAQMANQCKKTYDDYENFLAQTDAANKEQTKQQQEMMSQLGEKNIELCTAYSSVMNGNPNSICDGDISTITNESLKSANKANQGQLASEINLAHHDMMEMCGVVKSGDTATEICKKAPEDDRLCNAFKQADARSKKNASKLGCKLLNGVARNGDSPDIEGQICITKSSEKDAEGKDFYKLECIAETEADLDCAALESRIVKEFKGNLPALLAEKRQGITSSAPSFCAASNNSNMGKGQNLFEQGMQGIKNVFGSQVGFE